MAPNLFVAAQTVCQPKKWFRKPSPPCQIKQTEEWSSPVPGRYQHTARGWYLTATRDPTTGEWVEREREDWQRVIYWHYTHRYVLQRAVIAHSREGSIEGKDISKKRLFYNVPDNVGATWIQCWDKEGEESLPGPYPRYLLNVNGQFSMMTQAEARELYRPDLHARALSTSSASSHGLSPASSLHPSAVNTPAGSRKPSMEFERPSLPRGYSGKRDSLAVPGSRPRSREPSSRSSTPSPMSTPATELDTKELAGEIGKVGEERKDR